MSLSRTRFRAIMMRAATTISITAATREARSSGVFWIIRPIRASRDISCCLKNCWDQSTTEACIFHMMAYLHGRAAMRRAGARSLQKTPLPKMKRIMS